LPYTRRIILQKARRQAVSRCRNIPRRRPPTACQRRGSEALSSPSRGAFHLSLRYWFTIGGQEYSRLGGWSPQLPTGFLVPRGTQEYHPPTLRRVSATGLSPAPVGLPRPFAYPTLR